MKNITVSVDEEIYRRSRFKAAGGVCGGRHALRRGILDALLHRQSAAASPSTGSALATARDDPPMIAASAATAVDQISIVIFTTVALFLMARIDPSITMIAVAGGAMRTGEFSVGDFALFAYYLTFLAEFSAEFGGLLLQYRQAQVSWRRIGALSGTRHRGHWSDTARPFRRDEPATRIRATEDRAESSTGSGRLPSSVEASAAADGPEPLRELRLSGLCVSRPPRGIAQDGPALRVLDGISLTFRPGELVAVAGRVGAGKTTLLKALLGLVPVESGAILWNGGVVRDPGTWFRYPVCTYVPQEPHLFSVSIRENIMLEPSQGTGAASGAVDAALRAAVLARDVARLPHDTATVVGAAGTKLSGGQRQRLASARAFYHGAPLVVLDDPCSALDPGTEREYLRFLTRLARDGALCLVSGTGKALLTVADRIAVLRRGSVEATGTLPELLSGTGELPLLWNSLSDGE